MEKRESGLPETRWYIDLPTEDIAGSIEKYERYHFDKMNYIIASEWGSCLAQSSKSDGLPLRQSTPITCTPD